MGQISVTLSTAAGSVLSDIQQLGLGLRMTFSTIPVVKANFGSQNMAFTVKSAT